jgi:hypothetical protein
MLDKINHDPIFRDKYLFLRPVSDEPDTGFTEEELYPEFFVWTAFYNDGTKLEQFEEKKDMNGYKGIFHQFGEIDQKKLKVFRMSSYVSPQFFYDLEFNSKDMKLVHFYRNYMLNWGGSNTRLRLYCFGYERKINDLTRKSIHVILPNGGMLITDKKNFVLNFKID